MSKLNINNNNKNQRSYTDLKPRIYTFAGQQIVDQRSFIKDCEAQLDTFTLQGGVPVFDWLQHPKVQQLNSVYKEYAVKIIEDISILIFQLTKSEDYSEYIIAILNFIKLRTGKSLLNGTCWDTVVPYFKNLFNENVLQSGNDTPLSPLRNCLKRYEEIKNAPIFKKLYRFLMYCMSLSIFDKIGLTFDKLKYTKFETEAIKKEFYAGPDFVYCILDTMLYICEKGYQCMRLRSFEPIYHSGGKYEEWYVQSLEIKNKVQFLHNPEAHNIDEFSFINNLNEQIEKGEAIYKHAVRLGEFERKTVGSMLSDLKLIKSAQIDRKFAQKERKAPFSILVYGGSSVGKSSFVKILFYHYGKIFKLPTDEGYKYTRNALDQFFTNFNSSQWCVHLDDIGFMNPDCAKQGDPSVMEMLQINNNVSFMPAQASLEDKGKTPMRCRLLLATTNNKTLNANAYFSCPYAVQRRFPYIVDLTPKAEYTSDGQTLDSSKVPPLQEGLYPDLWNITILIVKPVGANKDKQMGVPTEIFKFTDIYEFLSWYSVVAKKYDSVQTQVLSSDRIMREADICTECFYPKCKCLCDRVLQSGRSEVLERVEMSREEKLLRMQRIREFADAHPVSVENLMNQHSMPQELLDRIIAEEPSPYFVEPSYWAKFKLYILVTLMATYIKYDIFRWCYDHSFGWFSSFMLINMLSPDMLRAAYREFGNKVQKKIGKSEFVIGMIVILTSIFGIYKGTKWFSGVMSKKVIQTKQVEVDSSTIGSAPKAKDEERENVWYKNDFELTSFDLSPASLSSKSMDIQTFISNIFPNCVHITALKKEGAIPNRAICVVGNIYITNNHALPNDEDTFVIRMVQQCGKNGINANIEFMITQTEIHRYPSKDLAVFIVRNVPPKKDISQYFTSLTLDGVFRGVYAARNLDGSKFIKPVQRIMRHKNQYVEPLDNYYDVFEGKVNTPTDYGDCGSLLILQTELGYVLGGIHFMMINSDGVSAMLITKEFIDTLKLNFPKYTIQCGQPLISAPSAERKLGDLHHKSPFRYLEEGVAQVYGSFQGFRAAPKSRVDKTYICDEICKHGYSVKYGAPKLRGWKHWYTAAKDSTRPVMGIRNDILDEVTRCFTNDIVSKISQEELKEVIVYDDFTALNGAAGVTYVDKVNRNTSMGAPWRRSKKYYINHIPPRGQNLDPIEYPQEVMDRVNIIIDRYTHGIRYMPVYSGQVKDEAKTFAKILAEKNRIFTGCPADWGLVCRKYLLSVVRLIQKNRFIFEAAPGTIAQSLEWQEIYNYLVHFGKGNIVAGDYGKFDKSMPPNIILAAGSILYEICKRAGYTDADLLCVSCLVTDIAYPLVDFNGDLVQFYGSNPSGHPLTVIINSLANSLYMRYCYYVLNPAHECESFQSRVHLMTYGDDNVMGICDSASWFNHTAIQNVLCDIGIEYTMADKESKSIPFIHISDVSFLKRSWRYDSDVGAFLCPLEHDSIEKMLTVVVKSKTICPEEQAIAVLSTAIREYFYYGKTIYEEKLILFRNIIEVCNLQFYCNDSVLPSWLDLKEQFWKSSKHVHL